MSDTDNPPTQNGPADGPPDPAAGATNPAPAAGDGDDTPPPDAEARTDAGAEYADHVDDVVDVDDLADEIEGRRKLAPNANVVIHGTDDDGNATVTHHDGAGAVFAL